ncbi:hypothetical protein [Flagellimonas halotolerans]|uniref:Uncharacterized protein n=1 Tax=Flagellimonas halotolerans TaxID=3112164 RepID=A0ABU6IMS0_9FLAO|nr:MULTISPECIES: hypothetical protein [unclassified Allomuricauda]MEC3964535.1 hypothetical protein [Muricauda sp. SYSU M86414]MEC4264404.1 hypothetical protein [Muricauda sp. SYSU M84420]
MNGEATKPDNTAVFLSIEISRDQIYTGEWEDDKRSGTSKFYDAEGDVVAGGKWNDDKLVNVNKK